MSIKLFFSFLILISSFIICKNVDTYIDKELKPGIKSGIKCSCHIQYHTQHIIIVLYFYLWSVLNLKATWSDIFLFNKFPNQVVKTSHRGPSAGTFRQTLVFYRRPGLALWPLGCDQGLHDDLHQMTPPETRTSSSYSHVTKASSYCHPRFAHYPLLAKK